MSDFDLFASLPEDFSGPVKLFPLPNLVLFPHVIQPLHIFEARYRALTADALDGDGLLAMSVLKPGWEKEHPQLPPIESVACLSRILAHVRLPDGRYNLCLQGVARIQITAELPHDRPYRRARVKLLNDCVTPGGESRRATLKKQLLRGFRGQFGGEPGLLQDLEALLKKHISLATLTDIVAYTAALDAQAKIDLLSEIRVDRRAESLIEFLAEEARHAEEYDEAGVFPPAFSVN